MPLSTKIEKLAAYPLFKLKSLCRFPQNRKAAFIHISSINPNRRLLQIVSQFLYCGYSCYLDITFKEYIKSDISGRTATLFKNVYPAKKGKKYDIIVSDKKDVLDAFHDNELKIFFNLNIFNYLNCINKNDLFYPITLFRKFIAPPFEQDIYQKALGSKKRKIAALFIGNVDSDYNNEMTKKIFSVNTRHESFSAVSSISPDILYIPKTLNAFLKDIESGVLIDKIVLLNINDFSIPGKHWFNILLETSFFIYMCGYIQPYCHNQIEAMLAGCIPVTQFNRFFIPHFKHGENAVLFNTLEELKQELVNIASGTAYDESKMKKNILKYYQENYSFSSFEKKLSAVIHDNVKKIIYHIAEGEEHILGSLKTHENPKMI